MLRRFSNRREAVPESIAAKSLGKARPIHTMNAAPEFAGQAYPFVPNPEGKSRRESKARQLAGTARKPARPKADGELL
jgi:hypothetical protein